MDIRNHAKIRLQEGTKYVTSGPREPRHSLMPVLIQLDRTKYDQDAQSTSPRACENTDIFRCRCCYYSFAQNTIWTHKVCRLGPARTPTFSDAGAATIGSDKIRFGRTKYIASGPREHQHFPMRVRILFARTKYDAAKGRQGFNHSGNNPLIPRASPWRR